jgi:hypothetical protein
MLFTSQAERKGNSPGSDLHREGRFVGPERSCYVTREENGPHGVTRTLTVMILNHVSLLAWNTWGFEKKWRKAENMLPIRRVPDDLFSKESWRACPVNLPMVATEVVATPYTRF